jgi:hypothetical protein
VAVVQAQTEQTGLLVLLEAALTLDTAVLVVQEYQSLAEV